ncbi:hypothetical protein MNEG_14041 [Monoraphidium neglectum]|uniref:Uncharacterized protein n=1 Tax=Monoraphidium neglectum TaxID=145388 RepID=A0A0D2MFP0_9CHLO|nr:hypothetical protein MNEG_14041 [Monoraphidium neglectum]KIY93920.1 hypothetical protein MNEG_14041 [Monoraphidium neglectum]|eukprot:XP_013892940.1 hypothetical protein MNEG_14041 [Monoraphidium neglectum]
MGVYYAFAWVAALLAALRCLVQLLPAPGLWNALWLVTQSGLAATTQQALVRTLGVAGAAAGVDAGVKALYIYALHVPLLLDGSTAADPFGDARWSKWSFWLVRAALPAAAYCYVAALPSTPHRALLPAKPELSRHAACLAAAHALQALGAALVGSRAGAGYCVFGAGAWLYDALFPPLVYCTFLLGFFGADELDTDLLLYSEMREAEFV